MAKLRSLIQTLLCSSNSSFNLPLIFQQVKLPMGKDSQVWWIINLHKAMLKVLHNLTYLKARGSTSKCMPSLMCLVSVVETWVADNVKQFAKLKHQLATAGNSVVLIVTLILTKILWKIMEMTHGSCVQSATNFLTRLLSLKIKETLLWIVSIL